MEKRRYKLLNTVFGKALAIVLLVGMSIQSSGYAQDVNPKEKEKQRQERDTKADSTDSEDERSIFNKDFMKDFEIAFKRDFKGFDESLKESTKEWSEALKEGLKDFNKNFKSGFDGFDEHFKEDFRESGKELQQLLQEIPENMKSSDSFEEEKRKTINKVYKVGASDQLSVENKFGKVHVNTWDKNEVAVEVQIIARASTAERALQLLDKIDVKISQEGNLVAMKTSLEATNGRNRQSFEINYTISMPKNNSLKLVNSFGDSYVASLNSKTDLAVSYGNLKADNLASKENRIKVSFGSGNVSFVKQGDFDISYSKFTLGNTDVATVKSDFSDLKIEQAGNVSIKSKYGDVKLGNIRSLDGSSGFSDFKIEKLGDKLDMKVQYCGEFEIESISRSFKSIDLDAGFSSIDLNFEGNAAYNFDVAMQFGDLKLDKDEAQFSLAEKKNNSSHHIGKMGKPGNANVRVKAQYGDVKMNEN